MKNERSEAAVLYMLRHLLTFNVTDPLSDASRGITEFTSYFSGTGAAGQINYLERKPASGGRFAVTVGGVAKTINVDFTLNSTTGTITWTGTTPASGTDNIKVVYDAVKGWIFDDHPAIDTQYFPRLTVLILSNEREDRGQGMYSSYAAGIGQYMDHRVKIIVRHRRNTPQEGYVYGSMHVKNRDIVFAIAKQVTDYFNTNRAARPWKFWDWKVMREEPVFSEEDVDSIIRQDITVSVRIFEGGG